MAAPAELIDEQIVSNIETALNNITEGSTYHYTPEVTRADQYFVGGQLVLRAEKPIALVIRDSSESVPTPDNRQFGKDNRVLPVFILIAHLDEASDANPWSRRVHRGTIRNRRIRDVMVALDADRSRGGLAHSQEIADINKDFEEGAGAWILAELVVEVEYEFTLGSP